MIIVGKLAKPKFAGKIVIRTVVIRWWKLCVQDSFKVLLIMSFHGEVMCELY